MAEKIEHITDKEHTYLVLKYGPDYLYDLARTKQANSYRRMSGHPCKQLSDLETKAATIGEEVVKEREQAIIQGIDDDLAKGIAREIDDMLLVYIVKAGHVK